MKRALKIIGIVVAVLLVVVIALPFLIDANQFRPMLESNLTRALGREVKVGNLKLALLSGGVTADELSIADDPKYSKAPFVQAKSLHIGVDLSTLIFSRKLHVTGLTIDHPEIALLQSPSGDWNYSDLGTRSATAAAPPPASTDKSNMDLSVKLVKISGGRFTLGHTGSHLKPLVLEQVDAELHDFSATTAFPFSLSMNVVGGGTIKLSGNAGPIDQEDVSSTPATLTVNIAQLDLAGTGLNQTAPAMAGVISLDATGASTGKMLDLKGTLKAEKVKLAPKGTPAKRTVELNFAVMHDLKKRSGTLKQADLHIGSAVSHLTGVYASEGDSTVVKMTFDGNSLAVPELAEMLPAMAIALPMGSTLQGGTATVKLAMEGPLDKLITTGTLSVNNTKLAGFNLGQKMSAIEKLAGINPTPDTEIQELSTNVHMSPQGVSTDAMKLVVPSLGDLDGSGTISPESALDFHMRAAVHTGGVAAVIANTPIPFTVEGTCSQPVFRPDLKAVMKDQVRGLQDNLKQNMGKSAGSLLKGLLGGSGKKD